MAEFHHRLKIWFLGIFSSSPLVGMGVGNCATGVLDLGAVILHQCSVVFY